MLGIFAQMYNKGMAMTSNGRIKVAKIIAITKFLPFHFMRAIAKAIELFTKRPKTTVINDTSRELKRNVKNGILVKTPE